MSAQRVEHLTVGDMQESPIWQFVEGPDGDNTFVQPVEQVPCDNLSGKLVATEITFADGSTAWGVLGNVHPENAKLTELFISLSLEHDGHWLTLARYFDLNYESAGPEGFASAINKSVEQVFPISYDVSEYVVGSEDALVGEIPREPTEKLSDAEIIALAVPPPRDSIRGE